MENKPTTKWMNGFLSSITNGDTSHYSTNNFSRLEQKYMKRMKMDRGAESLRKAIPTIYIL
jgi:hypothetical protein